MNKTKIRKISLLWSVFTTFLLSAMTIFAEPTPTPTTSPININETGIKEWIQGIVQPITNVALFVIPLIAVAATLVSFAQWFALDDQEKQQRPFSKVLKRNGLALIVAESIPVVLKLIGY